MSPRPAPATPPFRPRRARRIIALVRKESLQIVRDPSSLLIAVFLPLMLLVLFGFGVSFDLRRVPICVVVEQPSQASARLAASFEASRFFAVTQATSRPRCQAEMVAGRLNGIVVIPADFDRRLRSGIEAPIQVLVDGSDPNTAGLVQNYIQGTWIGWRQAEAAARGIETTERVGLVPRYWFNEERLSRNFLLPGLVAVIMSLIGALLTALVVAREWERGTMEALMATPLKVVDLVIGKMIPYFALGMVAMTVVTSIAIFMFGVPFRGSYLALAAVSSVFLLAMLGLGLLISTAARNQFVAAQAALFASFLPAVLLSGLIFEIPSMPLPIRVLTYLFPARYFVPSLQTLFLAGDTWSVLLPNTLAMALIAAVFFLVVARITPTRLD